MKAFLITGAIRCGHRIFTVNKMVIAESAEQAIAMYRKDHPNAKMIQPHFRYEVKNEKAPRIIFTNLQKKP